MKRSSIILLAIALLAAGTAFFVATNWLSSQQAPVVQQVATAAPQPSGTKVLVAKAAIGVGERLTSASVEWQDWPQASVRKEYISQEKDPHAIDKVVGAVARFEIFIGEPILDDKLVHSDQGFLSAVLDPGMRGVSISISAASGSGGFIIPNDRVDVLDTDGSGGQTSSHVVLSDVKVLAIGARLGQTGATGAPADGSASNNGTTQVFNGDTIATLELTPTQAQTLVTASSTGKISLVLRSVVDFGNNAVTTASDTAPADNDSTVKVIRFGHIVNVTPGTTGAGPAPTVNNASYVQPNSTPLPPATPVTSTPAAATPAPATGAGTVSTMSGDGTVVITTAPAVAGSASSAAPAPAPSAK